MTRDEELTNVLQNFFIRHGLQKKYWIAYSGGLDSHVLLHLCQHLRSLFPLNLAVIHINHNLSENAKNWAEHCQAVCIEYNLPFMEHVLQIEQRKGMSLEEEARKKRHALFVEYMKEDDILLTAHHEDDQAETLLLQLTRGAGPKGLASMPEFKPFVKGFHGRPLLHFPRSLLMQYAQKHALVWIEDESNENQKLTRNFLRHEVLKKLKTRWPNITNTLSRVAKHCAQSESLLNELALDLYEKVKNSEVNTLAVAKIKELSTAKQCLVLRAWIEKNGYRLPNQKKMMSIQQNILLAAEDRQPHVTWDNVTLKRHCDQLYLLHARLPTDLHRTYSWDLKETFRLPHGDKLKVKFVKGGGLSPNIKFVSIQFRRGGERLSLPRQGRRTLKNLFQEWNVLPWERESIPLIFFQEKLISVVGYFIDKEYQAKENELGRQILLERSR